MAQKSWLLLGCLFLGLLWGGCNQVPSDRDAELRGLKTSLDNRHTSELGSLEDDKLTAIC